MFELGDGLLGTYGVDSILEQEDIRKAFTGVVLSANDPVAAYGGVDILRKRYGIEPIAVTGPSTDNAVGVSDHPRSAQGAGVQCAGGRRRAGRLDHRVGRPHAGAPARSRRERITVDDQ